MGRYLYDAFLGRRGQRHIDTPAQNLAVGSDYMGNLPVQNFPRRGFAPQPVAKVALAKHRSGELITDATRAALRSVDRVAPKRGTC